MAKGITEAISDFTLNREKIYQQGKLDGAKEYKEWLISKYGYATVDIEEDFAEWQKGKDSAPDLGYNPYQE